MENRLKQSEELRKRAEAVLLEPPSLESITHLPSEEIRRKFHDLRVHQVELEMQNEELRRAQAELATERRRYYDLYDLAPVGYCTVSEAGLILEANLYASTLLGALTRADLEKQPMSWFILNEDQDIYYLLNKQLFETGEPQSRELRMVKENGTTFWAHLKATTAFDAMGTQVSLVVLSDITERKAADEDLQDQRFRLTSILGGTHVGTWEWNIQSGAVIFNERWAQMIGYSLAELPSADITTWERFAHPDDLQQAALLLDRHFAGELPFYDFECRMKHRDGHWIWVHDRGRVFTLTKDGEPLMMFGTHLDITERKQMENQLLESRENYRRVFENKMLAVCIVDTETLQIIDVNDTHVRLFGYSREELLSGMKVTDLSAEPEGTAAAVRLAATLNGELSVPLRYHRRKDGTIFPAKITGETYMRDGRLVTLGVVRDISQRMQAEEELEKIHSELERKVQERTADLEKTNATLAMMLDYARRTETDIQERVVANLRSNILGIVNTLRKQPLAKDTQDLVELLETTTLNLAHPIARNLESQLLKLTTREIQLANFIRLGKSTKELVELLDISKKTVETHRDNLRKKLGIHNKKINLRTYLNSEFTK